MFRAVAWPMRLNLNWGVYSSKHGNPTLIFARWGRTHFSMHRKSDKAKNVLRTPHTLPVFGFGLCIIAHIYPLCGSSDFHFTMRRTFSNIAYCNISHIPMICNYKRVVKYSLASFSNILWNPNSSRPLPVIIPRGSPQQPSPTADFHNTCMIIN